ncbi:hypothetical protein [Mesorhizobium sp. M2A.F.Ca.ET.039.01.1.1]|uniref:hypothetical protein n=1 Tax=Mesorhizobium sp. M2A.F.Ca.ET.039.01.1.1 TaxID=2496746 RepID=UPI000FC9BE5D|nr:hypothetical protein [Mesorhizobium sp. M2A.F.Ca.ET.039.01.1.1]RWX72552.1 hypothetical protein EOA24_00745 [Mesorhizobium sp. M2A.F.Ca.ET.039.01.1.1]
MDKPIAEQTEELTLALEAFALTFEGDFWRGSPAQAVAHRIAEDRGGMEAVRASFEQRIRAKG